MAKQSDKHRSPWTPAEIRTLKQLARENTPTRVMGLKLGRTPSSIYQKARAEGISLKPTNQSPYNRQKTRRRARSRPKVRLSAGPR